MNEGIHALASFIYGEEKGPEVVNQLSDLAARWKPFVQALQGPREPLPLTQRDAILITYADQLQEPGVAPLETLGRFAADHLAGVLSAVHLLPFYPWSSDDGFSVKDYFTIAEEYGTWENLQPLAARFDLMFDAVFNHLSAQGSWFREFLANNPERADFFTTVKGHPDLSQVVRPRALPLLTEFNAANERRQVWTTFSADQVDLNFANPAVLIAVTEALLFYLSKGAKFIRLDAIAYLWKEIGTSCIHLPQTHAVIQLWRALLDEIAPQAMLITETNVPHPDNIWYFGDGRDEAQLVYNFALPPLVLHTLQTGNATRLTAWADTLELPSQAVTFFNFLASHDGIGVNPARGILKPAEIDELVQKTRARGGFVSMKNNPDGTQSPYELNINYFDALNHPHAHEPREIQIARFLVAQGIMLVLRGVPGIYFHSLFGSRGDRAGAEAAGIFRRINREKLPLEAIENELADPMSLRAQVFLGFRRMLHLRRSEPAFSPGAGQTVLDAGEHCFALLRSEAGSRVLCLFNVTNAPRAIALALVGFPEVVKATNLLQAEHEIIINDGRTKITLPPYGRAWLKLT
ncbi:MAG: sugar phosphorylase [Chthoniobacteraceae bacterium]